MGPHSRYVMGPHPEDSAIELLRRYSETYTLKISVSNGIWTVAGPGLAEPVAHQDYASLTTWLLRTYGIPKTD